MSRPWFRFYRRTVNNPKVQRLRPELFRAWVNILCATDDAGRVPPLNDLAFTLRVGEALANKWISELTDARLLWYGDKGPIAHDWNEHQFESDVSTDRVKRFRQRSGNGTRNAPDTESDTEQTQIPKPTVSAGPIEIWKSVWNEGRAYLVAQGQSEGDARKTLMRWRQNYHETEILKALKTAEANAVELPIPYVEKLLKNAGRAREVAATPARSDAERWSDRLAGYQAAQHWDAKHWGPPPGQEGYRGPAL